MGRDVAASGRTLRAVAWSAVEHGGTALVSFAALIVFARWLSPDSFGLFAVAFAVIELLGLMVTMVFHDALVQREHVTERHFDTAHVASLGLGITLAIVCWGLSPWIARGLGHPEAQSVIGWLGLALPCSAAGATLVARQKRQLAFRSLAMRSLVGRLLGAAIGIGAVLAGAGLWGLVAQQVAMAAIGSAVLWFGTPGSERPRLRFDFSICHELLRFGAASVAALLLSFSAKRLFMIAAGALLGTAIAGLLSLALRLVDMLVAICTTAATQVALPLLSRLQDRPAELEQAYRRATRYTCAALYPVFMLMAIAAPEIVEILFGPRWQPAATAVSVFSLVALVQAARLFMEPVLVALGEPRKALIGPATDLAVVGLGIPVLGVWPTLGCAIAVWVARDLATAPAVSWMLRRVTGWPCRKQFASAARPFAAAVLMLTVLSATRAGLPEEWSALARLLSLAAAGAMAYMPGLILFDRNLAAEVGASIRKLR